MDGGKVYLILAYLTASFFVYTSTSTKSVGYVHYFTFTFTVATLPACLI